MKRIVRISLNTIAILLGGFAFSNDEESPSKVTSFHLYMSPENLELLYTRDPQVDERLPGQFSFSSAAPLEKLPEESIRFRGRGTRHQAKRSFSINFEKDHSLLFDDDRMNLNAMFADPSMMRDRLSYNLFHELNQPAPRTRYFDLYLNDIYEGLYIHLERIDRSLLRHAGLDTEAYTLVRDRAGAGDGEDENEESMLVERSSTFGADIASVTDLEAFVEDKFDSRGDPEWAAVAELVRWVHETPSGPEFAKGFSERFNVENFTDWLAIHYLIGDIDAFADDYWLYLNHMDSEAKWMVIPWDKDLTFGIHAREGRGLANSFFAYEYPLDTFYNNALIRKFLTTSNLRAQLYARMQQLMEEVFTETYFETQISATASAIGDSVTVEPGANAFKRHPKNHHGALGRFTYHLEVLQDFVELRYAFLGKQIHPSKGVPYNATVNLQEHKAGDSVLFTDVQGWTIAKLELSSMQNPGPITLTVEQTLGLDGIDRVWTVDTGKSVLSGKLTLYYRNDIVDWMGRENWYTVDLPVGDQWELTVANFGNKSEIASTVNPYSNKVVTNEIALNGTRRFIVVHKATAGLSGMSGSDLLRRLRPHVDLEEAGWTTLAGQWTFRNGQLLQHDMLFDRIISYWRTYSRNYLLQVNLQHQRGSGGGILFNMPRHSDRIGAHLVRFSDDGLSLFWGYFNENGLFLPQGDALVSPPENDAHVIEVRVGEGNYSIHLDARVIAKNVPLQSLQGHIGLTTSRSIVAFNSVTIK